MNSFFIWILMGSLTLVVGTTIENSRIIVTGGANGIGHAIAHDLLSRGAAVVAILDIDVRHKCKIINKFNTQFGENRAIFFRTDVSDPDQFEASFRMAVEFLGGLDIMINDAGILDDSRWRLMIDTNIKGLVQGTLLAIDVMGKHKSGEGGTIINIGSTGSFEACQYIPVYCATKHAILGFTRGIALNYEQTGVAIKIMCPGGTNTHLMTNPAPRYLELFDQEKAWEWLVSYPLQKTEVVSKQVIRLIEEAPNGAIWVTAPGLPTMSLDIPEYTEWGTPV